MEWLPDPLTTGRVIVRRPEQGDEGSLARLFSDAEVREYLGGPLPIEDSRRRATQIVAERAWGDFVVEAKADGVVIGSGDVQRKRGPWELSYQFSPTHWGLGLAFRPVLQQTGAVPMKG